MRLVFTVLITQVVIYIEKRSQTIIILGRGERWGGEEEREGDKDVERKGRERDRQVLGKKLIE